MCVREEHNCVLGTNVCGQISKTQGTCLCSRKENVFRREERTCRRGEHVRGRMNVRRNARTGLGGVKYGVAVTYVELLAVRRPAPDNYTAIHSFLSLNLND